MPVNSISPSQQAQTIKQSDIASTRKQADIRDADKVKDRKAAADQNARVQKEQARNEQIARSQEVKPGVNSSGQKVGTLINTSA